MDKPVTPKPASPRPAASTTRPTSNSSTDKPQAKKQRRTFKNDEIRAHKILIINEDWTKSAIMPRAFALAEAEAKGMDLVQLAYDATEQVATAKIVDFGKYMYDKKKKDNEKKKTQTAKGQKEIKFGYNIGDNDLALKIKKAKEFLAEGYIVKLMVVLRGREKAYKDIVYRKFVTVEEQLQPFGRSQGIKSEQFWYALMITGKWA